MMQIFLIAQSPYFLLYQTALQRTQQSDPIKQGTFAVLLTVL